MCISHAKKDRTQVQEVELRKKMVLNLLPTAEIKPSISFFDSRKSTFHLLPKPPGGIRLKRRGLVAVGRRIILCSAHQSPPPAWPGSASPEAGRKTWDGPKPISIVGFTGSIGTRTLDIVAENPDKFRVVALPAGSNVTLLADQVRRFKPQLVSIRNESLVAELKEALADVEDMPEIIPGEQGIIEVTRHPDAVRVVTGIVGCAGLQCIQGLPEGALRRIIFTASGGAFRDWSVEKLKVADALKHPNWSMGKKITVDSATLFNKGLEVIEAHYLFQADYDNIDIVIHPQSIIHSMIETQDSSVLAQLGWPDMRLPILYTMSWLDRVYCSEVTWPRLDHCKIGYLDIFKIVELTCDKHREELVVAPLLEEIVHYDLSAREYANSLQRSSGLSPVLA